MKEPVRSYSWGTSLVHSEVRLLMRGIVRQNRGTNRYAYFDARIRLMLRSYIERSNLVACLYASSGDVNDHLIACFRHGEVGT